MRWTDCLSLYLSHLSPSLLSSRSKSGGCAMERVMARHYDFDLTYITERIISVFFLPLLEEQRYRGNLQEVAAMLKSKHQDKFLVSWGGKDYCIWKKAIHTSKMWTGLATKQTETGREDYPRLNVLANLFQTFACANEHDPGAGNISRYICIKRSPHTVLPLRKVNLLSNHTTVRGLVWVQAFSPAKQQHS